MSRFCVMVFLLLLSFTGCSAAERNVALNCQVAVSPAPNYASCGSDAKCLTDGVFTKGLFWKQKSTVGWHYVESTEITVDLGKVRSISGASYSTAAGSSEVGWPQCIVIMASDDRQTWRYIGDLVELSASDPPSVTGYSTHRFVTHHMATHGRYLRFTVCAFGSDSFCDEVEVYAGPDDYLGPEYSGEVVTNESVVMANQRTKAGIKWRLTNDLDSVNKAVKISNIGDAEKEILHAELMAMAGETASLPTPDAEHFRTVYPINAQHARIFRVYSSVLRSKGLPGLVVWKKNRYDYLSPFEIPRVSSANPKIDIAMMRNEFRSDSLLLTNTADKPVRVSLGFGNLPGAPRPDWLSVYSVPWTDTDQRRPVAAALVPAVYSEGAYEIDIPSGMTTKVWLTVDSSKVDPGKYSGSVSVNFQGNKSAVPFAVSVSEIQMVTPRLSLGMWDYCSGKGRYAINEKNMGAAIDMMRTHFVDSPWAVFVLGFPTAADFDAENKLISPPAFDTLDRWLRDWPDARNYFIFLAVETSFAGAEMGTKEFDARIGEWMRALDAHVRALGVDPGRLKILLRDEPGEEDAAIMAAWARPIKASGAGIKIFQDSTPARPDKMPNLTEAFKLSDIACPRLVRYVEGGRHAEEYFQELQSEGVRLWFYACEGPTRHFDPYLYYRLMAWYAFKHSAEGIGFWSFGDTGFGVNSWNEYAQGGYSHAPVFISPDSVTSGIHWEAVREGIEDFEYLSMLRDAVRNTENQSVKAESDALLSESVDAVVGKYIGWPDWSPARDRSGADKCRLKILRLLERLK